jgi:hypothetical protein
VQRGVMHATVGAGGQALVVECRSSVLSRVLSLRFVAERSAELLIVPSVGAVRLHDTIIG